MKCVICYLVGSLMAVLVLQTGAMADCEIEMSVLQITTSNLLNIKQDDDSTNEQVYEYEEYQANAARAYNACVDAEVDKVITEQTPEEPVESQE